MEKIISALTGRRLIVVAVVVVLVAIPFATPVTVFFGSHLNDYPLFKIWKELVLALVVALIVATGAYKGLAHIQDKRVRWLFWLILGFAGWLVFSGIVQLLVYNQITWEAFIYAGIVDMRFLFFFILCWLVASKSSFLYANWQKLLFIPAAIVVGFGLLQQYALPADFLTHFGYGPDTITAYQTVDQKEEYVRLQSTMRGPNPLGAYLIIIVTALVVGFWKKLWLQAAMVGGSLIVLFYSYSRSAWLGVMAAVATLVFVSIKSARIRKQLTLVGVGLVIIGSLIIFAGRNTPLIQNVVFHTDDSSQSAESSNEQRAGALQRGVDDVIHEPFGRGPGSAGPASLRNEGHPGRIAENFYLQLGQELGWVGLGLFIAINVLIVMLLWQRRQSPLARVLLASFAGITLVNMLSHAWTDDTLSLLWWGMAGIAIASVTAIKTSKTTTK